MALVFGGLGFIRRSGLTTFVEVKSRFGTTLAFVFDLGKFFDNFLWVGWYAVV
jgi:hypothetical protein